MSNTKFGLYLLSIAVPAAAITAAMIWIGERVGERYGDEAYLVSVMVMATVLTAIVSVVEIVKDNSHQAKLAKKARGGSDQ